MIYLERKKDINSNKPTIFSPIFNKLPSSKPVMIKML